MLHDLNSACRYASHRIALKDGAVVAQGRPAEVVTADLVEDVFGMPCEEIAAPQTGTPLVVPAARNRRRIPLSLFANPPATRELRSPAR